MWRRRAIKTSSTFKAALITLAVLAAALLSSVGTLRWYGKQTIAAVGVELCGQFMGAVTVQGSGVLTGREAGDPQIAKLVKPLPDSNRFLLALPCPVAAPQQQAYYAQPER